MRPPRTLCLKPETSQRDIGELDQHEFMRDESGHACGMIGCYVETRALCQPFHIRCMDPAPQRIFGRRRTA